MGGRFSLKDVACDAGASILAAVPYAFDGLPVPNTFLNEHYRCHPGIITFCKEQVYAPAGNVSLSACLDGAELDARYGAYAKSRPQKMRVELGCMRSFMLSDGAHFDFLIADRAGDPVLAIEVDGSRHRAPTDDDVRYGYKRALAAVAQQRACDRVKDEIVHALGGCVLLGNRKDAALDAGLEGATMVLLRLPTDGTSAFEVDALKRGAPAGEGCLSIEDILKILVANRAAASCAREGVSQPFSASTLKQEEIGKLPGVKDVLGHVRERYQREGREFPTCSPQRANKLLVEAGLITFDPKNPRHKRVTALGARVRARSRTPQRARSPAKAKRRMRNRTRRLALLPTRMRTTSNARGSTLTFPIAGCATIPVQPPVRGIRRPGASCKRTIRRTSFTIQSGSAVTTSTSRARES